jgi:hypothetical protein
MTDMIANSDCYSFLDAQSDEVTRSPAGFTALITPSPAEYPEALHRSLVDRYRAIKEWQTITLTLIDQSLRGELDYAIAGLFLRELPEYLCTYHKNVFAEVQVNTPVFFRTDEPILGIIAEVQAPGSRWGVYEQLQDYYIAVGSSTISVPLSEIWVTTLRHYIGADPIIHHLLDNLAHPAGERYFVQRARRYARYYGYDKGIRALDCNFVRGHNYLSLRDETFFSARRAAWTAGDLYYDLPPVAFFEQKIQMCLPFWKATRRFYPDRVRELFPFTCFLTADGVTLEDGELIGTSDFCKLPPARRQYYLKYGGPDISRNWGGRSVYNLASLPADACAALLDKISAAQENWIVQRACSQTCEIEYIRRDLSVATCKVHPKYSCFYGPESLMGVLAMHEQISTMNGDDDIITSLVLPSPPV